MYGTVLSPSRYLSPSAGNCFMLLLSRVLDVKYWAASEWLGVPSCRGSRNQGVDYARKAVSRLLVYSPSISHVSPSSTLFSAFSIHYFVNLPFFFLFLSSNKLHGAIYSGYVLYGRSSTKSITALPGIREMSTCHSYYQEPKGSWEGCLATNSAGRLKRFVISR